MSIIALTLFLKIFPYNYHLQLFDHSRSCRFFVLAQTTNALFSIGKFGKKYMFPVKLIVILQYGFNKNGNVQR